MKLYILWYHVDQDWNHLHPEIHAIFTSKEKAEKVIKVLNKLGGKKAELNKFGFATSEGYELEEKETYD